MKASFAVIFVCVAATIALALGSVTLNLEPGMVRTLLHPSFSSPSPLRRDE
jgi:hypothetical protein